MALITCNHVTLAYEGKCVLSDLSFEVEANDYLCVLGENGAGKSTLIQCMLGLKKAESGEMIFGDGLKKNEVGYLPQQSLIQKEFPAGVKEVVLSGCLNRLGWKPFYGKQEKMLAEEKMELMGISHLQKQSFRELSGGQQQRVLLARALCATSRVLIMDEPVTGLDPKMALEFYRLVEEINQKTDIAIIMVSHDVKTSVEYAKHVLHLGGQNRFFGTKEEYIGSRLGKYFLGMEEMECN